MDGQEHNFDRELRRLLPVASRAALKAGAILEKRFNKPLAIHAKGIRDIVTDADHASEGFLRDWFARYTPDINFFGEETGGTLDGTAWVVDPLDGTKNFAHGIPMFGVSIGLVVDGVPVLGAVYFPILRKLYTAITGGGAWLVTGLRVPRQLFVGTTGELGRAFLATGFPHSKAHLVPEYIPGLENVLKTVSAVRRFGSAAYDLCMVAEGVFDGFWEYGLEPYDMAGGAVVCREAGAIVTCTDGSSWTVTSPTIAAFQPSIRDAIMPLLAEHQLGR